MIEAGVPSTEEESQDSVQGVVPIPPGANMVARSTFLRNADRAQFEGRASPRRGASEKRSQGQYKG